MNYFSNSASNLIYMKIHVHLTYTLYIYVITNTIILHLPETKNMSSNFKKKKKQKKDDVVD